MRTIGTILALLLASACTGDDTDVAMFAVDSDSNGAVDCADLDHVVTCVNHPDATGCEHADVNHDGHVDDADIHDIYDGLTATGHHCTDPDPAHDDPHAPAH